MISKIINKPMHYLAITSIVLLLTSCAATQTALEHRNLEVSTKLSKTIFLDPVPVAQKTIYIAVKNTSDENLDIAHSLATAIAAQGYKITANPASAHYILQANVLKIGKMSQSASQAALGGGFGATLAGISTGAAVGALSNHSNLMIGGGLGGGLISVAADSLIKNVNFTMITDIQIAERVAGVKVHEQYNAKLANGIAAQIQQTATRDTQYQRYRTRIVSNASKVNLSFAAARPWLEQGLVKTLAGIF